MGKKVSRYEPQIKPKTQKMDVGGLEIPPTNTITALLYGFKHHTEVRAREYYFWRIADMLWNRPELPEPMLVKHPWATQIIRASLENKYLSVGGAASSGKSHTMAAYAIVVWLSSPADTTVLLTSTTLREARKRIWGSIVSLLSVIDGAPFRVRDSIGNVAYINPKGMLVEKSGLSLIAAEKKKEKDAIGKFIGIKNKNVLLCCDELTELSEAILQAGLSNLSSNPNFQLIGLSNPASHYDAFGIWSEPKEGSWGSVTTEDDEWETKWGGKYIRLDGLKSPNIIAGKTIYPWLPTKEKIDEERELLGENSRGFMRMVRAVFFDSDEDEGIYSEADLSSAGAMGDVSWQGTPVPIAGMDPSFSNGGDRCILYTGLVGYDTSGQYVCELRDAVTLADDATNTAVPRSYQIAQLLKEECQKRGIKSTDVAVDATGAGSPLCDIIVGEGMSDVLRVSFGGKASDRKVSTSSKLRGHEVYTNRCTELWFAGKELCRNRQLFGITNELAQEMVGRKYDMVKTGNLRMKIESKPEFRSRLGKSPDLADAAFLCVDLARQRHGLVAAAPPGLDKKGNAKPRRSLKGLSDIVTGGTLLAD